MNSHVNQIRNEDVSSSSEDEIPRSFADAVIENRNISVTRQSQVRLGALQCQRFNENDSCASFTADISSNSFSPETSDPSENRILAYTAGSNTLKAASVSRSVGDKFTDAIEIARNLEENSRKKAEVYSEFAPCYISIAEMYRVVVEGASEKTQRAPRAARNARIAGCNAQKAANRLYNLKDLEPKHAENANYAAFVTTTEARKAEIEAYKTACITFETKNVFWKKIRVIRSWEEDLNRDVDEQSREKMKFFNILLFCAVFFSVLLVVLPNHLNIDGDSGTLKYTVITVILGSMVGFLINLLRNGQSIEDVGGMEKIRREMETTDKILRDLKIQFEENGYYRNFIQ